VRSRRDRILGHIEEFFLKAFFVGTDLCREILALETIIENEALVSQSADDVPKVPTYTGGRLPLSTHLANRQMTVSTDLYDVLLARTSARSCFAPRRSDGRNWRPLSLVMRRG
jgi:hypothetical protein